MIVFKSLLVYVVQIILLRSAQTSGTIIIGAKSAEEQWKDGQPPFWTAITSHLNLSVALHPTKEQFDNAIKNKQIEIETLVKRINRNDYCFYGQDTSVVWIALVHFLYGFVNPAIPDITVKKLKDSESAPFEENLAVINGLTPAIKNFIHDLCFFVTEILKHHKELHDILIKDKHFIYDCLTVHNIKGHQEFIKLLTTKNFIKKPFFDVIGTKFGLLIRYKDGKFYKPNIFGIENARAYWNNPLAKGFFNNLLAFLKDHCIMVRGMLGENDCPNRFLEEQLQKKQALVLQELEYEIENGIKSISEIEGDDVTRAQIAFALLDRFLKAIDEPLIPENIAKIMRQMSKEEINGKLQSVFNSLSGLPLPNKELINAIFTLGREIYEQRLRNGYTSTDLARTLDPCLSTYEYIDDAEFEHIQALIDIEVESNCCLLSHIIENYYNDGKSPLYFDETKKTFEIRNKKLAPKL